jgi:hypothetical protein
MFSNGMEIICQIEKEVISGALAAGNHKNSAAATLPALFKTDLN